MNAEQEVVRLLGDVEKVYIELLESGSPAEGADCDETAERFDEVAVERRFGFQIEKADLAGGAEVELLQD